MNEKIPLKIDDEEIIFGDLTKRKDLEAVLVCKSGNIYLFDLKKDEKSFLTKLPFNSVPDLTMDFNPVEVLQNLSQTELAELLENQPSKTESIESIAEKNKNFLNGLALNAKLYSFENYICIVQQKGISGVVLDLSNPNYQKILTRGDYQLEHCQFPIAFYKKDNQTFLIHGTDWNRLDITCLETAELLTERIVDYQADSNYFDYFHSSLLVSPDGKHFTSNGWAWGPCDIITNYSIDKFLKSFELSNTQIEFGDVDGYNWDRPLCWIDNQNLGIGYNKKEANEGKGNFLSEIIFFDIFKNEVVNRIDFDGFALSEYGATEGDLFYNSEDKHFIGINKKTGALITDAFGNEVYRNSNLTNYKYSLQHNLFYQIDTKKQVIEFEKKLI